MTQFQPAVANSAPGFPKVLPFYEYVNYQSAFVFDNTNPFTLHVDVDLGLSQNGSG